MRNPNDLDTRIDREEFRQWYTSGKSNTEIAAHFGIVYSSVRRYARRIGLPKRDTMTRGRNSGFPVLSEEEIARRCELIQQGWDAETERSRRVTKDGGAVVPLLSRTTATNGASNFSVSGCDLPYFNGGEEMHRRICRAVRPDGTANTQEGRNEGASNGI